MTVLLLAACQSRQGEQDKAKSGATPAGQSATGPSVDKGVGQGADKPAEPDPFAAAITKNLPSVPDPAIVPFSGPGSPAEALARLDNAAFRDRAVAFVREVTAGGASVTCTLPLTAPQPLQVSVWLFHAVRISSAAACRDCG